MKNINKGDELSMIMFYIDQDADSFFVNAVQKIVGYIVREGSRWRVRRLKKKMKNFIRKC